MRSLRHFSAVLTVLVLSACAEPVWAPEQEIRAQAYTAPGPASLTLVTVVNSQTGTGAHTGLLIDGSQSVMWDPAGTWWDPNAPERNDLHYGMTDRIVNRYINYHTRERFHTILHKINVPRSVADQALQAAAKYGAAPKAQCSLSTTRILDDLPGFEAIRPSLFPLKTMQRFAALPGARERKIFDDIPLSTPRIPRPRSLTKSSTARR